MEYVAETGIFRPRKGLTHFYFAKCEMDDRLVEHTFSILGARNM